MTSRYQPPPIIKAAQRLLVDIEQFVRGFDRYHKYQIGSDLRRAASTVLQLASRAWRDHAHKRRWLGQLVWAVDELKQHMQTAKLIKAFRSFRHFEHLARQAEELGAQVGGAGVAGCGGCGGCLGHDCSWVVSTGPDDRLDSDLAHL